MKDPQSARFFGSRIKLHAVSSVDLSHPRWLPSNSAALASSCILTFSAKSGNLVSSSEARTVPACNSLFPTITSSPVASRLFLAERLPNQKAKATNLRIMRDPRAAPTPIPSFAPVGRPDFGFVVSEGSACDVWDARSIEALLKLSIRRVVDEPPVAVLLELWS